MGNTIQRQETKSTSGNSSVELAVSPSKLDLEKKVHELEIRISKLESGKSGGGLLDEVHERLQLVEKLAPAKNEYFVVDLPTGTVVAKKTLTVWLPSNSAFKKWIFSDLLNDMDSIDKYSLNALSIRDEWICAESAGKMMISNVHKLIPTDGQHTEILIISGNFRRNLAILTSAGTCGEHA